MKKAMKKILHYTVYIKINGDLNLKQYIKILIIEKFFNN